MLFAEEHHLARDEACRCARKALPTLPEEENEESAETRDASVSSGALVVSVNFGEEGRQVRRGGGIYVRGCRMCCANQHRASLISIVVCSMLCQWAVI